MPDFAQDFKYACRKLASQPGWTAVAVFSLALGIGVNSTAFSVADALFLKPLPVPDPDRLVELRARAEGGRGTSFSYAEYQELSAAADAFEGIAVYSSRGSMLKVGEEIELLPVNVVSGGFFEALGIQPLLGRTLRADVDSNLDGDPVVVLSYSLWQRRFGGDLSIVGKTIRLNDSQPTVVGILPASFRGLNKFFVTDIWMPPATWAALGKNRPEFEDRKQRLFHALARLRVGASKQAMQSQVAAVGQRLQAAWPDSNRDVTFHAAMMSEEQRQRLAPAIMLLAIVGLVLWIACGNVAGLLLAQAERRRREIGIRQALGASRGRLVRQLLTEGLVLAGLGAALGLVLAHWLLRLEPALMPPMPFQMELGLGLDLRVVTFTLLWAGLTVILFALAPALKAARVDVASTLKGVGEAEGGHRMVARTMLVSAQVALAVVLINTSGLLLRSFLHTRAQSPGFDTGRNLISVLMVLRQGETRDDTRAGYEQLRERAAALPGARRASYARRLPMASSGGGATVKVEFPGLDLPEEQRRAGIKYNQVGPGYFEILGTRLVRGRGFGAEDGPRGSKVALISDAFARRYFADSNPVDRSVLVEGNPTRIVGVVEDVKINGIHEPAEPYLYLPFAQAPAGETTLLVETAADPAALVPAVRRTIREQGARNVILTLVTMRDHMRSVLFADWLQSVSSAGLAGLGVALAAVGLFAAVAYAAARRAREFGVRLALGAEKRDVFALVLKQAFRLSAGGIILGLALALAVAGMLRGMLYGVGPADPATLAVSAALACGIAVLASLGPARRAVQVDPVETLRSE